jgi:hypothetical protein
MVLGVYISLLVFLPLMMHHFAAENMLSVTSDNKVSLAEFIDEQN